MGATLQLQMRRSNLNRCPIWSTSMTCLWLCFVALSVPLFEKRCGGRRIWALHLPTYTNYSSQLTDFINKMFTRKHLFYGRFRFCVWVYVWNTYIEYSNYGAGTPGSPLPRFLARYNHPLPAMSPKVKTESSYPGSGMYLYNKFSQYRPRKL